MTERITHSRNFKQRPLFFRMLNRAWKITYPIGNRIRFDKDELIKTARKRTGLIDLGKDFWDEPLERLLKAIDEEAFLHPVGRFITRERFINLLNLRLRAEYYFRRYPEILNQELYPAWIIIGLQRTGTTKLQRLLAADPGHRVILSWEAINPVPLDLHFPGNSIQPLSDSPDLGVSGPTAGLKDKRIGVACTSAKAVKWMSPGFYAIHPIDVHQPEEDILLLDASFLSTTPEAMMNVPSYAQWLEKTDQSLAYAYAAKLLKLLQWQRPGKRWILKTPHHLEFPDQVIKYFGDVHFLWPHRNIYESVPSFLSMVTYTNMIFSDQVDERRIARHWVRKTGYMLEKTLKYRAEGDNHLKFLDIHYKDLIADAIRELDRIYQMDGGLSAELRIRFEQHERDHPHRKYGTHQYSLDDFGLTKADIDKYTCGYQRFISDRYDL